jgi:hypothetical protein
MVAGCGRVHRYVSPLIRKFLNKHQKQEKYCQKEGDRTNRQRKEGGLNSVGREGANFPVKNQR